VRPSLEGDRGQSLTRPLTISFNPFWRSLCRQSPPSLPDEILHEIFSFATHVEGGLVSPHWRVEDPYVPWVISSQARRSIPLVCRQWHVVGLEHLYQHIVIFTPLQLVSVLDVTARFAREPNPRLERLGWVRGLEFIILRGNIDTANEFTRKACALIRRLPQGRLRLFGFEDGTCHEQLSRNCTEIIADALHKAEGCLEVLHLPCVQAEEDQNGRLYYASDSRDFTLNGTGVTGVSKLHTISFTSGSLEECMGVRRSERQEEMIFFLTQNLHSIRTVYLSWPSHRHLGCLRSAIHLQTIHMVIVRKTILAEDLDEFLEVVPQLRRLILTLSDTEINFRDPPASNRDTVSHESLKEMILKLNPFSPNVCKTRPIFSKVQRGHLPELERVIIHGLYPEGCLDGKDSMSTGVIQYWKDAIEACGEQGVDLVDEGGNAIHLWDTRHSIRFGSETEDTESNVSSLEGGYREMSGLGFSGSSVASDDIISDDSEDGPYRYVSQPDLDYDDDSEHSNDGTDSW
jgi:hypothetical protein